MVPEFSERIDKVVNEELAKASDITLTTDGWTSKATENYLGVFYFDFLFRFFHVQQYACSMFITGNSALYDADFQQKSAIIGIVKLIDHDAAGHAVF